MQCTVRLRQSAWVLSYVALDVCTPFSKAGNGRGTPGGPGPATEGGGAPGFRRPSLATGAPCPSFPAGCASLSLIKMCTHISNTEPEQAPRNWKLPEPPYQERARCPGSESCVMPGHSLNFSGTLPTRLGTGWAQMASELCPGRHSHLKSRLVSSPMHFLAPLRLRGSGL